MTVNVEVLVRSLGRTYQQIVDAGTITYKTKPAATSGEPTIHLDMANEGLFLSFKREGRVLKEVSLKIQHDKIKNWFFPNELPFGLKKSMSRLWIHEKFGEPSKSTSPKMVMKRAIGSADLFNLNGFHMPVSMQIRYDLNEMVKSVVFLPTAELRW
ncbi:pyocin immunity protein [Rahnella sp. C60]|uniref:DUF6392 family protein n=1 Tax=Rahnella perminowiae TaxID=2816244 RepID=UPI001C25324A|nr:DUF6392 family protein [Rahnella perminowiae]MBU9813382.1 pyocin immunity protein [Rahnella perminowiae]